MLMLIDVSIVLMGYLFSYIVTVPRYLWISYYETFKFTFLIIAIIYIASYVVNGMYKQMWRYADVNEYRLCLVSSLLAGGAFIVASGIIKYHIPLRVQVVSPFIITFLIIASRIAYKILVEKEKQAFVESNRKKNGQNQKKRLAIIGAGEAGALLYKEIRSNPLIKYDIIMFIDDNPNKIGRKLYSTPIYGGLENIEELVHKNYIEELIIAIPNATGEQRKRVVELSSKTDANVKILPSISGTLTNSTEDIENNSKDILISKLRNIDVEDLLGRDPVRVDEVDITKYIKGKVVLVTGGGGSIGGEICRQVASYHAKKIIILDNYENGAYEIEQELISDFDFVPQVEIASVQDFNAINKLFQNERKKGTPIQVVFHAAAHKHVPLMENNPERAIKNNIIGTYNIARVCNKNSVEKMILISTDKAVNPVNIMGATKRACEIIIESMNRISNGTIFTAVRFGNVLASNGSVIPLFKKQIEKGGPVTVTHPDIIRYFMTIPEAVSLVLNAGGLAKGGEIFILDMGEPVKILDLARNLIKLAGLEIGTDIDIIFTGLRPGEKLYEELMMEEEGIQITKSEKIFMGKIQDTNPHAFFDKINEIYAIQEEYSKEDWRCWLQEVVKTYHRQDNKE